MSIDNNGNIAQKTIRGSIYSVIASIITLGLGFFRFILLLKLLLPEDFGVFAQALFFVALSTILRLPGLDRAFIQRKNINEQDTRTYFTLKIFFLLISILIMICLTQILITESYPDMPLLGSILITLLAIDIIKGLNSVQEAILQRNLSFRAIAGADILSAITATIVAPYLAWQGFGAWSLVGERLSAQIARSIALWGLFSRPWWPRFGWEKDTGKWYLNFSIKLWVTFILNFLIDKFDDFWIGKYLGKQELGYYSRAYEFARYPRRIVANPILSVFYSTYSRLQSDRLKLSRAFFRATSLMVRTSFWFALVFVFCAPEFITMLGGKWLPMLLTFQLMIIYTLLDPLSLGASNLLVAAGHPEYIARTRATQVAIFIPAVIILGSWQGIEGVALAANSMMLVGTIILFKLTHRFVDYSNRKLWLYPIIGFLVTGAVVWLSNPYWGTNNLWLILIGKTGLITLIFGGLLWIFEKNELKTGWQMVWGIINPHLKRQEK